MRIDADLADILTISPPMRTRLEELSATRSDIWVTYLMLGEQRFAEWAFSVGVCTDPALAEMVPPIPPPELRRIVAEPAPEMFLWSGYHDLRLILAEFTKHRAPRTGPVRILDFGCGCGRLVRYLAGKAGIVAHAADVNAPALAWCAANLPRVRTMQAAPLPPLPLADRSLDLLFAVSVFTHLPQPAIERWIAEVARVLDIGGIAVVSIHGVAALDAIDQSAAIRSSLGLSTAEAQAVRTEFERERFTYRRYGTGPLTAARAGDDYGLTFIDPRWIESTWNSANLRVVEVIRGHLRGWQDIVILRRT